ncbi:MAG: glycosyltransferase family 4 protein [Clostridia bacterium]|nr:glycosyltransferase family 4 protein [Clostridia bacterium]
MEYKSNVDILYGKYLDENFNVTIGGVQTYINDLCQVLLQMGINVRIVQFASKEFVYEMPNKIQCIGFNINEKKAKKRYQALYDKAVATRKYENTITLFATDNIIPSKTRGKALAIQHGIFWDVPTVKERPWVKQVLARVLYTTELKKRIDKIDTLVCVDYNFVNWYRTQVDRVRNKVYIVPNYTKVSDSVNKPKDVVNIIFARRFVHYRGTRIFVDAIKRVLSEYKNVYVTVAGSGPDEQWIKEQLTDFSNVSFVKYDSEDSLAVHASQHIAVVPSTGSEGTSLSLLEAMSSQCAVICTDVGGMTNIVLDGYNGLMVDAGSSEKLYEALCLLINDEKLRESLSCKAYETVKTSFSYEKWELKWERIIEDLF